MQTYCRGDASAILDEIGRIGLDKCANQLAKEYQLSNDFIINLGHLLDINTLSGMMPMSVEAYRKYISRINWKGVMDHIKYDEIGIDFLLENISEVTPDILYHMGDAEYKSCDVLSTFINHFMGNEMMTEEHWFIVSGYDYINSVFMRRYEQYLNWRKISENNTNIPTDLLIAHAGILDWRNIWHEYKFSESELEKIIDAMTGALAYFDWCSISSDQDLTEAFMDKYANNINWAFIAMYQNMSYDFLIRHKSRINIGDLLKNMVTDRAIIDKFISEYTAPSEPEVSE